MLNHPAMETQSPTETIGRLEHYHFPPYITLAHLFSAPLGWEIQPRSMSQYQLQYVVSGTALYHVEGQEYVTKHGDLIFHSPNERHFVKMVENEPYVCISIVFHFGVKPFPVDQFLGGKHYLGRFSEHPIEKMLFHLVKNYQQHEQAKQLLCQGLLLQILSILSEESGNRPSTNSSIQEKTRAKLILIRDYIASHYNQDIQNRDLEAISGLSRNYIAVKFKSTFGMTPMEYMIWTRVEKAKEMAIHSNLSIGEIANRVGYADVHTFGKMFKKKVGTSLSEFCATLVTLHDHR